MRDKKVYISILSIFFIVIVTLKFYKVEPLESFSLRFNDINFALQKKKIHENIVFVAIDEKSVNHFGRWPWNRKILAKGIVNLALADVVLFDIIFSEKSKDVEDYTLAQSIASLQSSVCGFFLRESSTQRPTDNELEILGDSSLDLLQAEISGNKKIEFLASDFAELNIDPILSSCTLNALFSTIRESDQLFRSYPVALYFQQILYPSLGVQALRIRLNKDIRSKDKHNVMIGKKKIWLNEHGFTQLNFYNLDQYKTVSFLDLYQGKIPVEYFKDKIVIVGVSEVGAGDIVATPVGAMPGSLLHYTFLSNFLENHLITKPAYPLYIILFLFTFLPSILLFVCRSIRCRIVLNIFSYLLVYSIVRYLFVTYNIYIDMFYPLITLFLSGVIVESIAFSRQEKRSRFLKETFSSYLSSELLEKLIQNPDALKLGGEKKEITILFSDIRGFTTMSEMYVQKPEELINILNRYFTPMTEAVLDNGGMLDKYIGDAIMALYNAPLDKEDHVDAACHTALLMVQKLTLLNEEFNKEGLENIKIGIGINSAEVIVGNIGSEMKKDYTVIGDGVNLASRLEGLTKRYGVTILLTEFSVAQLKENFIYREIELVRVKGKTESVLVYELMEFSKKSQNLKESYDKALAIYKKRNFLEAKKEFIKIIDNYDDAVSKYMFNEIENNREWSSKLSTQQERET